MMLELMCFEASKEAIRYNPFFREHFINPEQMQLNLKDYDIVGLLVRKKDVIPSTDNKIKTQKINKGN